MVAAHDHLDVDVHDHEGRTVIRVHGEVDLTSAAEVRAHVGRAAGPQRQVIIDLAGVEFLDSTGLGSLVWAQKRLAREGGGVLIVDPRPNVRRVLEISGVARIVPVEGLPPPENEG